MASQQYIQQVKKLFDEVYSKGNVDAINEFFDKNVKLHDAAAPNFKGGISELKERESIYMNAFPNKQFKVEDIFAVDNKVVVRWSATGTHKGELQGIRATNKNVKISGISILVFDNQGKINEIYRAWDRLGLLEQIGEIQPAMALHR